MKIYKRNILKHYVIWGCYIPLAIFFIYQIFIRNAFNLYTVCLSLFLICVFLITAIGFNYIILEDDRITLRNSFYLFWNRTFKYDDIVKIIIKDDTGKKALYIRIVTHEKTSCRYGLGSLGYTNLQKMIEELQTHKIQMEIGTDIIKEYLH